MGCGIENDRDVGLRLHLWRSTVDIPTRGAVLVPISEHVHSSDALTDFVTNDDVTTIGASGLSLNDREVSPGGRCVVTVVVHGDLLVVRGLCSGV